jgi:hypothetical protein
MDFVNTATQIRNVRIFLELELANFDFAVMNTQVRMAVPICHFRSFQQRILRGCQL